MKRAISICLLILFLFNVGGYYILFWGIRHHANYKLNARLDAGRYAEDQLIELKIPITLPYPVVQQEYRRIHGRFEHKGEFYTLVKQRVVNDTVYIACIKDGNEKKLVTTMRLYANATNDLASPSKSSFKVLTKLIGDFENPSDNKMSQPSEQACSVALAKNPIDFISPVLSILSPPPRF